MSGLESLSKSAAAAALHGLDRAETKRKMDLLLERIDSLTMVRWPPMEVCTSAGILCHALHRFFDRLILDEDIYRVCIIDDG